MFLLVYMVLYSSLSAILAGRRFYREQDMDIRICERVIHRSLV